MKLKLENGAFQVQMKIDEIYNVRIDPKLERFLFQIMKEKQWYELGDLVRLGIYLPVPR
jgi:hypothetical protein